MRATFASVKHSEIVKLRSQGDIMKRTMLGGLAISACLAAPLNTASAADLSYKAPPDVAAPYNWTGFYVGGEIGGGLGTHQISVAGGTANTTPIGTPFPPEIASGFLGGGQIGYNWQTSWVVLGVQGDFGGTNAKGTGSCTFVGGLMPPPDFGCSAAAKWLATASGRVGGVVNERILAYVKGGGAWMNTQGTITDFSGIAGPAGASYSNTLIRSGWLVGMGTEYAFTRNWSGFIEYNYMDFGNMNYTFLTPAGTLTGNAKDTVSAMKAGLNYKF
jgi:outer membrane immunogenic protein